MCTSPPSIACLIYLSDLRCSYSSPFSNRMESVVGFGGEEAFRAVVESGRRDKEEVPSLHHHFSAPRAPATAEHALLLRVRPQDLDDDASGVYLRPPALFFSLSRLTSSLSLSAAAGDDAEMARVRSPTSTGTSLTPYRLSVVASRRRYVPGCVLKVLWPLSSWADLQPGLLSCASRISSKVVSMISPSSIQFSVWI